MLHRQVLCVVNILTFSKEYSSIRRGNMASARRGCNNHPDVFCYICGEYTFLDNRVNISDFIKRAYLGYFGVKLGDQDKAWAPHIVCKTCSEHLRQWTKGKRSLKFGVPMVWREPRNHIDDCYFCMVDVNGINRINHHMWKYPDILSAIRPVPHSDEVPIPTFHQLPELCDDKSNTSDATHEVYKGEDCDYEENDVMCSGPQCFSQNELSDLIRDLNLSKQASELLASRLNEKNLLDHGTNITFYRTREKDLLPFFSQENNLVFCQDVKGLLIKMDIHQYIPDDWRLFIDSSKRSLKCVLLHNGNKYGSIPIAHSTKMKEEYDNIAFVLEKIKFEEHRWIICVDLKMVNFLLGQQGGYTKYPCFLCLWDSRAKKEHWERRDWPVRETLVVGEKNIIRKPLVEQDKIILPPLHIKLGLMKQFVKALNQNEPCFEYISRKMPRLSAEKVKAGIFDGPQIRQLMKDPEFVNSMNGAERQAWESFVLVIKNFLGNHKAINYVELVNNMLLNFRRLGCNMSVKVHYLHSHLDRFPDNLGDTSEEQGERFHQDIKTMEDRYQGRWDTHMMADYCWNLQRSCTNKYHRRLSSKRSFKSYK